MPSLFIRLQQNAKAIINQSILKPLLAQWGATLFTGLVAMGLVLFLGRSMGPEKFGVYNYLLTLAVFWGVLMDGGYSVLLFREKTAPTPGIASEKLVPSALSHLGWSLGAGFLFSVFLPHDYLSGLTSALLCFACIQILKLTSSGLKGDGKFQTDAGLNVLTKAGSAILIMSAALLVSNSPFAIFTSWGAGILITLLLFPSFRIQFSKPLKFPAPILLRAGLPLMIIELATLLYFRLDMIVIERVLDARQVGIYAAAYRLIEGIMLPVTPLAQIWFRDMRIIALQKNNFRRILTWRAALLTGIAILPAGLFWIGSSWIINLLYGSAYQESVQVLQWLAPCLLFIFPNAILTQAALAANREKYYAKLACLAGAINLILNLILLPMTGVKGAAMATVMTEGMLCLGLLVGLRSAVARPQSAAPAATKQTE